MVTNVGWCRIEGSNITDKAGLYGDFVNIPSSTNIYYGQPEIQIYNKNPDPIQALSEGIVYRVVPFMELGNQFDTIIDIDANYPLLLSKIDEYDKTVDVHGGSVYYFEPFVVTEPCVIFYGGSTERTYEKYIIVLVDTYNTPRIIAISAKYIGAPIPINDTFELNDIVVTAIYEDGQHATIKQGYTYEPADRVIKVVGSNSITISYETPENLTLTAGIIITGVKSLTGITAIYDGPTVPFTKEAERKYFIVTANYSDGSSATVVDYTFPDGNIVTENNRGRIRVYYKGFYTIADVQCYQVSSSKLIAYYNGPAVEVGDEWMKQYATIKIYYKDATGNNSYYDDVNPDLCTFSQTEIDHEGINQIFVSYTGRAGTVSTYMAVPGIRPEIVLNYITAEYSGPPVTVGKDYSLERVIVKAYYSNGEVIQVNKFSVNSNLVKYVGPNEYVASFTDRDTTKETTFTVMGLEKESTTESGYTPVSLDNNYPEATRYNNRYRGPVEAKKQNDIANMLYLNINELNDIYKSIEIDYNKVTSLMTQESDAKYSTLNTVAYIREISQACINDTRFLTGDFVRDKRPDEVEPEPEPTDEPAEPVEPEGPQEESSEEINTGDNNE